MRHIVQYSGGVGSFAATCQLIANGTPREAITLLFCDTESEDEDLYRFLLETSGFLQIPITRLADGRHLWQLFRDRRVIANSQMDTCSETLKRDLAKKWIHDNVDPKQACLVFGIDWMEERRIPSIARRWDPYPCVFPLAVNKRYDKHGFMRQVEENFGIPLPRLYKMGFEHNNCGGFCVKAGKAHFLNLLEKLPERYRYHEERELEQQAFLGKPYTILRETRKGVKHYITLRELRERKEEILKTDEGQDEWGGCACFT